MLSAYTLALEAKSLGLISWSMLVHDGRIAYCAVFWIESYGIEIDEELVELQNAVSSSTGINANAIRADATRFDYGSLELSKPIFFISGLQKWEKCLQTASSGKCCQLRR